MSAKKRKSLNHPWNVCETCKAIVSQKDTIVHEENACPQSPDLYTHSYILDKKLFTFSEMFTTQDASLNLIPTTERYHLVLLSEQCLQLCEIPMGDAVLVFTNKTIPFIGIAWPSAERGLLSASLNIEAADIHQLKIGDNVQVEKFTENCHPALEIVIDCPHTISKEELLQLLPNIHEENRDRIFCVGNKFMYKHFGKRLVFEVVDLKSVTQKPTNIEQLENLKLNEMYCVIGCNTKWTLKGGVTENKKKEHLLSKIGGLVDSITELTEIIDYALHNKSLLPGLQTTRGVLLYGANGTGKSMLMKALAQQSKANVITIDASAIVSKYLGDTLEQLRHYFSLAKQGAPSIILIDEIDMFCSKSIGQNEHGKRIMSGLAVMMDELHEIEDSSTIILAATTEVNNIDQLLRRPGRFDREIEILVPNRRQRFEIMKVLLGNVPHCLEEGDIEEVADSSHGFVGADLASVVSKAVMICVKRNESIVSLSDLQLARSQVKPSAMREILIEVPNVRWADIGGQAELKLKLRQSVEWPLKHAEAFARLGITPPKGLLMFGPPGCSKTMIAKALATESQLNFISVKGPELFSKWVGESERAVRQVFHRARQAAPSIIFFDELDALGSERTTSRSSSVQEQVLAQLLTELDGVETLANVTIVGATNRPDRIDSALLRPGRLDRLIYVPLPDPEARKEIFTIQFRKTPTHRDVDIDELVRETEGYSGAEIVAVCHEAALRAMEEDINTSLVSRTHFILSLKLITPRTSPTLLKMYEVYKNKE